MPSLTVPDSDSETNLKLYSSNYFPWGAWLVLKSSKLKKQMALKRIFSYLTHIKVSIGEKNKRYNHDVQCTRNNCSICAGHSWFAQLCGYEVISQWPPADFGHFPIICSDIDQKTALMPNSLGHSMNEEEAVLQNTVGYCIVKGSLISESF